MGKVIFDLSAIENYGKEVSKLLEKEKDKFLEESAKLLASEFIKRVQEKTPVGKYDDYIEFYTKPKEKTKEVYFKTKDEKDVFFIAKNPPKHVKFKNPVAGKQGGTLKNGWQIESINSVKDGYEIAIVNYVDYAEYIENGHRVINKKGGEVKGFVKGVFMLKNTEIEMVFETPSLLEKHFEIFLKKVLKIE